MSQKTGYFTGFLLCVSENKFWDALYYLMINNLISIIFIDSQNVINLRGKNKYMYTTPKQFMCCFFYI